MRMTGHGKNNVIDDIDKWNIGNIGDTNPNSWNRWDNLTEGH